LESCRDRFIVGCEGAMNQVNRNLTIKASLGMTPKIYKVDTQNGYLYGVEDGIMLTKRNSRLELIKRYDNAHSFGLFEKKRVHAISFQTDTALIVQGDGIQFFYNLSNNKFSSKIRVGRVIPSVHDGKWYCFDYSREERKLWLRDITGYIHSELEWREFFSPREDRKKMTDLMLWFHDHDNFVYRPGEWGTPWSPGP